MTTIKRWPIGLQSSVTGDPQGIGQVIEELSQNNIALFSASTDSFSILSDLQSARERFPQVPHTANYTPTGYVDGYHLNVPEYGKPHSLEAAVRHWNKVEQKVPGLVHPDPNQRPIKWNIPCIWMSTWNEPRDYVGWFKKDAAPADQVPADVVSGYEGNADLVGWHAVMIGEEAVRRGYRWAAFGFAGGNPEKGFWEAPGVLEYLRLCQKHPDQLGVALHEYSLDDSILNKPSHIGRFKQLHDACDKHGIRRPVIQIKEFGWQATQIPASVDKAMTKLIEVAGIYMQHANIHGAALWTVQNWQGSGIKAQVRALIPHLRDAALAHTQPIPQLPAPPVVSPPPVTVTPTPTTGGIPVSVDSPLPEPNGNWPFSILSADAAEAEQRRIVSTEEFGIDVSLHQGDRLNWNQLKKDGVQFAFIRVGSGKTTRDANYIRNFHGCIKNEIPFGNYFYLYENVDIEQQARMFVQQANWLSSTLPPVVDIEQANLTADQIRTFITEFHRLVDSPPIMIYTRASLWNQIVSRDETWPSKHPLWVAHWGVDTPALPHHWDRWTFFQPGGKKGLAGYPPKQPNDPIILDFNHFNGSLPELTQLEARVHVRSVAFADYIPFDSPVGNKDQRRRNEPMWPGDWIDVNPYGTQYLNPSTGNVSVHTGADLNLNLPHHDADRGKPVYATGDGVVTFAGHLDVWGNVVVIKHSNNLYSRYGHVDSMRVTPGEAVIRGQQIAQVGRDALGGPYHLHFDISQSDVLAARPGHWPGNNQEAVLEHYLDPKDYIERHRPQDTTPATAQKLKTTKVFWYVKAEKGLHLRQEASTESLSLGDFPKGTKVEIYQHLANGWSHVRVNNQEGFMFTQWLTDLPIQAADTSRFQTGMNIKPDDLLSNPVESDVLNGMNWVRFVFKVSAANHTLDEAFAQYDPVIRAYDQKGIRSLIILNQEAIHWSSNGTAAEWQQYTEKFAAMASRIAERYRDFGARVAFQIWNEGDNPDTPHVSVFLEPAAYAALLKPTAEAIRSASPDSQIIFGGLSSSEENRVNYVKQVRQALNGTLPVDAIGVHPYGRWVSERPLEGWGYGRLQDSLDFYRAQLPGLKFWITEIGMPGKALAENPIYYPTVARYLTEVYKEVGEKYADLVPVVIWFAWSDSMDEAGIVRKDGTPKEPIFEAFRQVRDRKVFA